jgi:undecaprenyl-diphosphatase
MSDLELGQQHALTLPAFRHYLVRHRSGAAGRYRSRVIPVLRDRRFPRLSVLLALLTLVVLLVVITAELTGRSAADATTNRAVAQPLRSEVRLLPFTGAGLSTQKAVVLGLVEGITEFLPISSTGHLLVAEKLMDVGTQSDKAKRAADAYALIIQLGAILAVLVISWRRVVDVLQGVVGKSETGRRLLINLICAFVPAAAVGVLLDSTLEKYLLKPVPVAAAWLVGGVAILFFAKKFKEAQTSGRVLDAMTPKDAVMIGVAQSIALWPGVSRSLVTILGAILLGFALKDAVEFSFLLGLCTLGAAAGYALAKDGSLVFDTFGVRTPLIGMVVAFISAVVAVKWMVAYLNKRDLSLFGFYRIGVGVLALVLVATNQL